MTGCRSQVSGVRQPLCAPVAAVTVARLACLASAVHATPSTLILIPSSDIQAEGVWHFGVDDAFNVGTADRIATDFTELGLTYGVCQRFELGVDFLTGMEHPFFFNAKFQAVSDDRSRPALSVGVHSLGTADAWPDIWYALVSKDTRAGRFHAGYWNGDRSALTDPVTGADESEGLYLGWDRQWTDKWWAAVDFQSGDSAFGALSPGMSYSLSDNAALARRLELLQQQRHRRYHDGAVGRGLLSRLCDGSARGEGMGFLDCGVPVRQSRSLDGRQGKTDRPHHRRRPRMGTIE